MNYSLEFQNCFLSHVEENENYFGECWNWTGAISDAGYGTISLGNHKFAHVHRVSYEMFKGQIPEGLTIDHLCRNRKCANPDHLEPVTNKENCRRGWLVRKSVCKYGHPLSGDNLICWAFEKRGQRRCRICYNRRLKEAWLKRKNSKK